MKIVILNGSHRLNGNTCAMTSAFTRGAVSKGHTVQEFLLGNMDIHDCVNCGYCKGEGNGVCRVDDDMTRVAAALKDCDMVVFASPVYYCGVTGALSSAMARFYAFGAPAAKKYALFLTSSDDHVYAGIEGQYGLLCKYLGWEDLGIFHVFGDYNSSDKMKEDLYAFGASV